MSGVSRSHDADDFGVSGIGRSHDADGLGASDVGRWYWSFT